MAGFHFGYIKNPREASSRSRTFLISLVYVCIYQNPREASSRSRIFLISLVYVCICLFICVTSPGKNDTDLKFSTHTPIDQKTGFLFFRRNPRDGR